MLARYTVIHILLVVLVYWVFGRFDGFHMQLAASASLYNAAGVGGITDYDTRLPTTCTHLYLRCFRNRMTSGNVFLQVSAGLITI